MGERSVPADLVQLDAEQIDRERVARGLTKLALARAAGVSNQSIHRAIHEGVAGLRVARGIARVLKVELRTLLRQAAKGGADAA